MTRCRLWPVSKWILSACFIIGVSGGAAAPSNLPVYTSDFSKRPGPEWSSDFIGTTPEQIKGAD